MSFPIDSVKPASAAPRVRFRLSPSAEAKVRSGHPWVYAESMREVNRPGVAGELAVAYDRKDRFLGFGLLDPDSPIRVRMLHVGKPVVADDAWWRSRLEQSRAIREPLFDSATNGYRWINGESDGWPGLVLDRYDEAAVLKLYSSAWLPWLNFLIRLIQEVFQPGRMILRLSRNIQDGARVQGLEDGAEVSWVAKPNPASDAPTLEPDRSTPKFSLAVRPELPESVEFLESGLRFKSAVIRGQKTGFFLDQRDNRCRVESLGCRGAVLNAFSYSGGFSLYAARGGAASVTEIDISPHALASAAEHAALNAGIPPVAHCRFERIQADVFTWLEREHSRRFDLIILDPPSLAKREAERERAVTAYRRLAGLGIARLAARGTLLAASCSAHVSADEFFDAVQAAARDSGRPFQVLAMTGHPLDHPAMFPEAVYLKAIYLRFETEG